MITMRINSTFELSHIYYGDTFEVYQEDRKQNTQRPVNVTPFTETIGNIIYFTYVSGFHHIDHAKIWKAQRRVAVLNKWIYQDENRSNIWHKLDKGIYGERKKTLEWLEKMSLKYPEYWL